MNSAIKATGEVNIQVFKDGELLDSMQEKNLVVTLGKTNISKLLGGAGYAITKIALGTSNTAADLADTTITAPFEKTFASITYPDANSVQFNFDIGNADANGMTIREFGLKDSNGILFARKVRSTEIIKTSAIRLVGSWKITIN